MGHGKVAGKGKRPRREEKDSYGGGGKPKKILPRVSFTYSKSPPPFTQHLCHMYQPIDWRNGESLFLEVKCYYLSSLQPVQGHPSLSRLQDIREVMPVVATLGNCVGEQAYALSEGLHQCSGCSVFASLNVIGGSSLAIWR